MKTLGLLFYLQFQMSLACKLSAILVLKENTHVHTHIVTMFLCHPVWLESISLECVTLLHLFSLLEIERGR